MSLDGANPDAARAGDPRALDALIAASLPIVYNIAGLVLTGRGEVESAVRDTLAQVVRGLPGVRDADRYRPWLASLTIRQVRAGAADPADVADPGADFVDVAVDRLGLTGQRQELVLATRWLNAEDRELLALWWLENHGDLNRTELAAALGATPEQTSVRMQWMRRRLDDARIVVRALASSVACADLVGHTGEWDGSPDEVWRKRLARHCRECPRCQQHLDEQVPAENLLASLPLVPVPPELVQPLTAHALVALAFGAGGRRPQLAAGSAVGGRSVGATVPHRVRSAGRRVGRWTTARPLVAAVAAVVVLLGATAVGLAIRPDDTRERGQLAGQGFSPPARTASPPTPAATTTPPFEVQPAGTAKEISPAPGDRKPSTSGSSSARPPAGTGSGGAAPPPASSTQAVAKKGVVTDRYTGVTQDIADVGAGWYFSWSPDPGYVPAPAGAEFVPMIWGAKDVTSTGLAQAKSAPGNTVLTFNEPSHSDQADLTPSEALALWPQLQATGLRLGSPATTDAASSGGWLDQFMSGAAARGYRVDFIAVHWYTGDFSSNAVNQLRSNLQAIYNKYKKPIWLTEFALIDWESSPPRYPTGAQGAAFVQSATAMLKTLSYVERYSWYSMRNEGTGLYYAGEHQTTQTGAAYKAAG